MCNSLCLFMMGSSFVWPKHIVFYVSRLWIVFLCFILEQCCMIMFSVLHILLGSVSNGDWIFRRSVVYFSSPWFLWNFWDVTRIFFLLFFWDSFSHGSGCPQISYIVKSELGTLVLLPLPLECYFTSVRSGLLYLMLPRWTEIQSCVVTFVFFSIKEEDWVEFPY